MCGCWGGVKKGKKDNKYLGILPKTHTIRVDINVKWSSR